MKLTYLILLPSLLVGCHTNKKESQVSADTISVSIDTGSTSKQSMVVPVEPPISAGLTFTPKLPTYTDEIFTDDSLESSSTNALIVKLHEFKKEKYAKATCTYSFTIQVGNDYDESTSDFTMSEQKTWYFDADRNLRAYISEQQSDSDTSTTIYLMENNKMVACYEDDFYGGQISGIRRLRVVISQCPSCGVSVDLSNATPAEILNESGTQYLEGSMNKEYQQLQDICKRSTNMQITKNGYSLRETLRLDETPYTVKCDFDQSLYNKLVNGY